MLVFEQSDLKSFKSVKSWMNSIKERADESLPIVLVGNKHDSTTERLVYKETAIQLSSEYNIEYFDISANLDINIKESMNELIDKAIQYK